jgi:putative nucleotidyltransferase with HDIG domain
MEDVFRMLDRQELMRLGLQRGDLEDLDEETDRSQGGVISLAVAGIAEAYKSTLSALVAALDARESETADHSQRVVRFTLAIAERLAVPEEDIEQIARGALLHDIGKIGVSDNILLKPGPLTQAEWAAMRRHPEIGHQILRGIPFLVPAAEIVLCHQERWDGGGYPRGLLRDEIPLGARIFAIADTFDAITSDRPYRCASTLSEARREVARCAGSQFDPICVSAFLGLREHELAELRNGV